MRCHIQTYQFVEDAWTEGVEAWCRAASALVLAGGEAWLLAANAGQAAWLKARLLRAGVALAGVRFPDAAGLRRLLCARFGVAPPAYGSDALEFLLRLRALESAAGGDAEADAIARSPGAWRAALQDLDAAGWLGTNASSDNGVSLTADALPTPLRPWLPALRESGAWWPALDRELRQRAATSADAADPHPKPLSTLVLGWDAGCWAKRDLLLAALLAAKPVSAQVFFPAPRGSGRAEALAQGWIDAIATGLGPETEIRSCGASGFVPPFGPLVERLESVEFSAAESAAATDSQPEMLVGLDWSDQLAVSQEWVARWLLETRADPAARLAVLFPGRGSGSVEFVRALGRAGIAVEDNLGERVEPPLSVQIARALLHYQLDETGVEPLLTLVGLLNDCPGCWIRDPHDFGLPLEPVALRRALADAFTELQHRNARLLAGDRGVARSSSSLADPLGRLVAFLERWPETLTWASARARWEGTLAAFKLSVAELSPLWREHGRLLPADAMVPARAFLDYLRTVLAAAGSLPRPATERRAFARVFVTTLTGAVGQTWQGALFMDSNEGVWPHGRDENPCLDDRRRAALNAQREAEDPSLGHLLTGADRARQEAANFLEVLENCTGRVAFASIRRAPDDVTRDAHPNEWSLRCWVEAASAAERRADRWLERWRRAAVRVRSRPPRLPKREASHLRAVFQRRRDPTAPFDEYLFDFTELAEDEGGKLPLDSDDGGSPQRLAWTARGLEAAWHRPASFALETLFNVHSWRDGFGDLARAESAAVGRLTHRWVQRALGGDTEPRPLSADVLARALDIGLKTVRLEDEAALLRSLGGSVAELPPWWRGAFAKTTWAARQCLEALSRRVADDPAAAAWFCAYRPFAATVSTPAGPLQLRARPDLLLLDHQGIAGAACQVVDLKTGSAAAAAVTSPAHLAAGRGLGQAAELSVVLAAGADPAATCAAVLHPEAVCWEALTARDLAAPEAISALSALAQLQNGLRFGQRASSTTVAAQRSPAGGAETLPLACTPLDPAVLAAKAELCSGGL